MNAKVRKRVSTIVVHNNALLGFKAIDPTNGRHYVFVPGGEREAGESPEETATRETREETGYQIELLKNLKTFRKYDFEWNGKLVDCETWYFAAKLKWEHAEEVNDADYHKGVVWIPLSEIDSVFSYHPDILEPIQELLSQLIVSL